MNQDASHDPLDLNSTSLEHFHDDSHLLSSPDVQHVIHTVGEGLISSLHPIFANAAHHEPILGSGHSQSFGSHVIGEPGSEGVWHIQETPFTCAVVSQEMILKEFGIHVTEAQLMGDAMQHGWLTSDGTQAADLGKLLELHGIPCHEGQGINQMISELSQGHKLIVSVDSTDLWYGDSWIVRELHDFFTGGPADHALVVQGLRQDDAGSWHVIVNDPGNPNGAGHEYPLDQFTDAWEGSNCHFTSTDIPPHGLASDPTYGRGFDEQAGVYPGVMDWVHTHSVALAAGAAFMAVSNVSPKPVKSEMERNDILREI